MNRREAQRPVSRVNEPKKTGARSEAKHASMINNKLFKNVKKPLAYEKKDLTWFFRTLKV